jgi:hypothetical protein
MRAVRGRAFTGGGSGVGAVRRDDPGRGEAVAGGWLSAQKERMAAAA